MDDCFFDKKYLNHFESLEFKEYLNNLKEEDYEEYQELIKIINDDKDLTLEEIDQMLKEAEEDEKDNGKFV